jgi:hypothetical protein
MSLTKMSPEALERFRRTRREQRIGQRTKRRNTIRKQAKRLQPKPIPTITPGDIPGAAPVQKLKCGMCGKTVKAGHAGSLLCKPCHSRDALDESLDLSRLWLPPTSLDMACAAFDHEENKK